MDYGIRMITAKKQGQELTMNKKSDKRDDIAVDRVTDERSK